MFESPIYRIYLNIVYIEDLGIKLPTLEVFQPTCINPTALRNAKIAYNFGLPECNRIDVSVFLIS